MPRKLAVIVVEGPHDLAFVTKLLGSLGLKKLEGFDDPDSPENAWERWKEVTNPPKKKEKPRSFREAEFLPNFLQSDTHSVLLRSCGGDEISKMLDIVEGIWLGLSGEAQARFRALGLFVDTDKHAAEARFSEISKALESRFKEVLSLPGLHRRTALWSLRSTRQFNE